MTALQRSHGPVGARSELALGIDIGTGSTKAGLVDADGRLVAVARAPHPVNSPRPGLSEADPETWVDSARTATARVLEQAGIGDLTDGSSHRIAAVGFSGQMHGVVPSRADGVPVHPAVLWSDQRSQPHLDDLRARLSGELQQRLANPIVAGMAGPTMFALAAQDPSTADRAEVLVQPKDWVRWRLTDVLATDPSDASATLLWDSDDNGWSAEACAVFGVDPLTLPPVEESAARGGSVTARGADLFGLPAGVPVAVGAADTAAALLGAGVEVGELQVTTGTGGQLARRCEQRPDGGFGTHVFRAADHRWYAMAAIQNAGSAIDWALAVLDADITTAGSLIEASPVGSNGVTFLPYLTGERTPHLDAGLCGAWTGLRPTTTRADLIRSVFEGVAFALRDGLDALWRASTVSGASGAGAAGVTDSALLAGGGSTASWWRAMVADVLDVTLVPHDAVDASVRGAGLLAWSSIGHVIDPRLAVNRGQPIEPDPDRAATYRVARMRYRAVLPAAEAG